MIYLVVTKIRSFGYRVGILETKVLPGKVVSVGNLAVGGTGKSPVVVAIAKVFVERGLHPIILSRGYGVKLAAGAVIAMRDGAVIYSNCDFRQLPDEALMQSKHVPQATVVVGRKRALAAAKFLETAGDLRGTKTANSERVWILDDGFQHLSIHRDIDLVLIDEERGLGSGKVLPAGFLRESPQALMRATHIWVARGRRGSDARLTEIRRELTKFNVEVDGSIYFENGKLSPIDPKYPEFSLDYQVLVVAGIARPLVFMDALKGLGIKIADQVIVADHRKVDSGFLRSRLKGIDAVVTTDKDFCRQMDLYLSLSIPTYILPWNAVIKPELLTGLLGFKE